MDLQLILYPTDFSATSEAALKVALNLARRHSARVLALHVVPMTSWANKTTFGNDPPQPATHFMEAEARLRKRMSEPDAAGIVVDFLLLADAEPAEAIVQTAAGRGCDLIVMGKAERGNNSLGRWLFRSVPERVIATALCPVLLVTAATAAASSTSAQVSWPHRRHHRRSGGADGGKIAG